MKIAYVSSIAFADLDISLVKELSKYVDVTYFMVVGANKKSTAVDLSSVILNDGLTKADQLQQLQHFSNLIDLTKTFVLYGSSKRGLSWSTLKKNHIFYKFLKSEHFDVVHLTTPPSLASWELYLIRKRLVLTVHDPIPHSSANRKLPEVWRSIAFKAIHNLILLNHSQKEAFFSKYHLKEHKKNILISRLGPYSYLRLFDDHATSTGGDYILFFGNITSYKGLDYLFPAMVKLHEKYPGVKLVVAGKGNFCFDVKPYEQLDYFDIRNKFVPVEELAQFIRDCRFVVVPYTDGTQSGVVMSAFAFCKPCVVTNVGGLPEMVIDNRYGLVVPPKNSEKLAEAMGILVSSSNRLEVFKNNIEKDYFVGEKSWAGIAAEMCAYYNKVMQ